MSNYVWHRTDGRPLQDVAPFQETGTGIPFATDAAGVVAYSAKNAPVLVRRADIPAGSSTIELSTLRASCGTALSNMLGVSLRSWPADTGLAAVLGELVRIGL